MTLALIAFGGLAGLELLLWLPLLWRWRKWLASLLVLSQAVVGGLLVSAHGSLWTVLLLILSGYRIINLLRLVDGRTNADYLFRAACRSSLWLLASQAAVLLLAWLNYLHQFSPSSWLYVLLGGQLAGAAVLVSSTVRHLRTTRAPIIEKHYADRDLPSLTVAIPARNETDDLEACLQSLIGNDYPKLEILVLDDCSQEKRTPEIIRAFAHDGVRFIAGQTLPDHWLAKNYAYQQLTDEANGQLLLCCGVDARFTPDSLRNIVETMLDKKKTMLSLLPHNRLPGRWQLEALLVQPGRYAWELSLPRRLLQRPPVLSTCWLITAAALHGAGSFKAVKRSSSPESYFARSVAAQTDGYTFLQSDTALGLDSVKSLDEQRFTAIRTRYPQLHRRPELVGFISLLETVTLVGPLALLISSAIEQSWLLAALSALCSALLITFFSRVMALTYRRFLLRGLWLLPFAVLYDIGLLNYSMWQYEFKEVIWKGRNVCVPLMRVYKTLPET